MLFVGDLAFTAIFCVEMLLKLLVYGVAFHPKAYLRSVWNWLDMLVVVFSVLGLLLAMRAGDDGSSVPGVDELAGFAALRAVRLALWPACNAAEVRKAHATGRLPARRDGVARYARHGPSFTPRLISVAMMCGFVFFVFGMVGCMLFMGKLRNRCHHVRTPRRHRPLSACRPLLVHARARPRQR